MKYCTKGLQSNGDEIKLYCTRPSENFVPRVEEIVEAGARLILDITDLPADQYQDIIPYLAKLKSDEYAVAALVPYYTSTDIFKQHDIDFFFSSIVDTWDGVVSLCAAGVSDIEIGGELGFSIVDVAKYCHSLGIKVRVTANIAQASSPLDNLIPDYQKFFILPQDVRFYEGHVDVIEFYHSPGEDTDSRIYNIYKSGNWKGEIGTIIHGYQQRFFGNTIPEFFGPKRLNCQKRCNYGKCDFCGACMRVADAMKSANIEFREGEEE